jgi:hypothetical protein
MPLPTKPNASEIAIQMVNTEFWLEDIDRSTDRSTPVSGIKTSCVAIGVGCAKVGTGVGLGGTGVLVGGTGVEVELSGGEVAVGV